MVILVVPLLALATGLVCVCSAVLSGICWTLSAPVQVIGFLQLSESVVPLTRLPSTFTE